MLKKKNKNVNLDEELNEEELNEEELDSVSGGIGANLQGQTMIGGDAGCYHGPTIGGDAGCYHGPTK